VAELAGHLLRRLLASAPSGWPSRLAGDLGGLFSYHFMVNAYEAGTIVAVLAALVGWFMVLRRQSFAGHTLSVVAFPGAAAATLAGVSVGFGYYGFCLGAALLIAFAPRGNTAVGGFSAESAVIGTVQAFALASGFLFVALYHGFLEGVNSLLFGTFLGITDGQVVAMLLVALGVLAVLALVGRPLLFASIDPAIAAAHGVPVRLLGAAFLVLLGLTAAATTQVTGALLVFALLVMPPATAQRLTARPALSLALSVVIAVTVVWTALAIAYYSPYPLGFWVTTLAFGLYVAVGLGASLRRHSGRRRARHLGALERGA
jgi:zinc/manganese transport system permease protein